MGGKGKRAKHFSSLTVAFTRFSMKTNYVCHDLTKRFDNHTPKILIIQFHTSSAWKKLVIHFSYMKKAYHRGIIQLPVRMEFYGKKFCGKRLWSARLTSRPSFVTIGNCVGGRKKWRL